MDPNRPDRQELRIAGGRLDAGWTGLVGLMIVASALILYLGRDFTFYADEWFFVLYRDGASLENFLAGHGGHLVLFPVVLFIALFRTVGLDSYWVYREVALVFLLSCSLLVYLLARPRVGGIVALGPAGLMLFLGSGWDDVLRPFQITFTGAIAFGLLAFYLLDRESLKADVGACCSLLAAMGFSGAAVPFVAGAAVGLLVKGRFWRRLWVPALPALVYPIWAPRYSDLHSSYTEHLSEAPSYAFRMVEAAAEGITGLPRWPAILLLAVFAGVVATRLWQTRRSDALAWEALACGAVFWGITALSQLTEHTPGAPRYLYLSAVFLLLIGIGVAPRGQPRATVTVLVLVLFFAALPTNVVDLVHGAEHITRVSQRTRAELGAMQSSREVIDPEFTPPLTDVGLVPIPALPYFAAVGRYGSSPADGPWAISEEPELARRKADKVLAAAFRVRLVRKADPVPPSACSPLSRGASVLTSLPRSGVWIRAPRDGPAQVLLRQYAHTFAVDLGRLPPATGAVLRPDPESASVFPWTLRALASGGSVSVCRLAPAARP